VIKVICIMTILVIAEHDNAASRPPPSTPSPLRQARWRHPRPRRRCRLCRRCPASCQPAGRRQGQGRRRRPLPSQTAENLTALVVANAAGYSHILAPATTFGKNVAPRVAALLDVAQISEITAVESADTFVRPIYAGNALATVKSADAVKVITVRTTAFDAVATGGAAAVESLAAQPTPRNPSCRTAS
jgi:electron transfer flavoprotein alpha subunit